MLTSINIHELGLPKATIEFYSESDSETIKLALTYGHQHSIRNVEACDNAITQNMKSEHNKELEKMETQIKIIKDEYSLLKETHSQLSFNTEREIQGRVSIGMKYVDDIISNNKAEIERYKETLTQRQDKIDELEAEVHKKLIESIGSKTKGNRGESDIQALIESSGYTIKKPGNKAGDLWVFHEGNHIAVLEIKNWANNESKLGRHRDGELGPEIVKFYRDIDEQLDNATTTRDVPWLFLSLSCDIPNESTLINEYSGVKCFYLSQPSEKDILIYMTFCKEFNSINIRSKTKTTDFMQCKIQDLCKIINDFTNIRCDFANIEKMFCDMAKTAENNKDKFYKEKTKYNDRYIKIDKRMKRVMKNIDAVPTSEIDLLKDIDTERLTLEERITYNKQLRLLALKQQFQLRTLNDAGVKTEMNTVRKMVLTDFYERDISQSS
jgi:hypothetical protein